MSWKANKVMIYTVEIVANKECIKLKRYMRINLINNKLSFIRNNNLFTAEISTEHKEDILRNSKEVDVVDYNCRGSN